MEVHELPASPVPGPTSDFTLAPLTRVLPLSHPPVPDFISSPTLGAYNEQAKILLCNVKTAKPGSSAPARPLRHRFSVLRIKDSVKDSARRTFTKHDVAVAFATLVYQIPVPPPALAHAVLEYAPGTSIDELWHEVSENGARSRTPWLGVVTKGEHLDYIRLICHTGACQEALDDALNDAVSMNSLAAVRVLLQYGASPSPCKQSIRAQFRRDNVGLAKLLLAAPNHLDAEDWDFCLQSQASTASSVLTLALAHVPDLASGQMLLEAVDSVNLAAISIMIRRPSAVDDIRRVGTEACRRAHVVENDKQRQQILAMFAQADLIKDTTFLQEELARAVRLRQIPLIQLLRTAGVSLDANTYNAFGSAIEGMNFDVLALFVNDGCAPLLAPALDYVLDSASEKDILRLFDMYRNHIGESCDPLHRQLIRAVKARRKELIRRLLSYGAAPGFQDAAPIKEAIRRVYIGILNMLLDVDSSPTILSKAIFAAMALPSRQARLEVLRCIFVRDGAPSQTLAAALRQLVSANEETDFELIQLLLRQKAPLDGSGEPSKNCISIATQRGDLRLVKILCAADPDRKTVSQAVPIAFRLSIESNYNVALAIMMELLGRGAEGAPVHSTLLGAAKHDKQLKFVRELLKYHADANHQAGAAYAVAFEKESEILLSMLCEQKPSQGTLEAVLLKATDPKHYKEVSLKRFLESAQRTDAIAALKKCWSFAKLKDNPHVGSIITCFLKHGLDVNVDDGGLLPFAIQTGNFDLLKTLTTARPSITTLTKAFSDAAELPTNVAIARMMELLLQTADSAEIGQSQALVQQTKQAILGNPQCLRMLLLHKAAIDFGNGKSVQLAAAAGALGLLQFFLERKPAWSSICAACYAVAASPLDRKQKILVFEHLLNGVTPSTVSGLSELLVSSFDRYPKCEELHTILLARGAQPNFEMCKVALEKTSTEQFLTLLDNIKSKDLASEVFRHVIKSPIPLDARWQIYRRLLPKNLSSNDMSAGLLHYFEDGRVESLSMVKLLLEHGAAVGYKNGLVFRRALLGAESLEAFTLLIDHIKDDNTANVAFDIARKANITRHERLKIYRPLLKWAITKPIVQETLVFLLKTGRCDDLVLQLLLRSGADPNQDGAECFVLALNRNAESEFRILSSRARLDVVVQALMARLRDEGQVIRWMNLCLEGSPTDSELDNGELLFACLRAFPKGTTLLRRLLDKGVPASATTLHSVAKGWAPEKCSALIWALCAEPKVSNETICTLIEHGGMAVLPAYTTPLKEVSAAFLCLLDRSRIDVLEALLRLDEEHTLSYEISWTSFEYLAMSPSIPAASSDGAAAKLSLSLSALYLGNLGAYRLLARNRGADDGVLHTAVFFALPDFVEWCLRTDHPNHKIEAFDWRIPLAVACAARQMPWCKIGNERNFRIRQMEIMQKLAPVSDANWRERKKTILHIAFDYGPETTTAMLDALKVVSDRNKHTKYRYSDQLGKEYSPIEYVTDCMGCSQPEKDALIACLAKVGFTARPGLR